MPIESYVVQFVYARGKSQVITRRQRPGRKTGAFATLRARQHTASETAGCSALAECKATGRRKGVATPSSALILSWLIRSSLRARTHRPEVQSSDTSATFDGIVRLLKPFVSKLNELVLAIKKQTDAVSDNTEVYKSQSRIPSEPVPPISPVSVELKSPITVAIQGYSSVNKQPPWSWRDWLRFAVEVIGLMVLIWYACTTYRQWKTMDATLNETANNFGIDERAWVEIESIKLRTVTPPSLQIKIPSFVYDVYTKNFGKTVARDIVLKRVTSMDANHGDILARGIAMAQDRLLADQGGEPSQVPSLPIPKSLPPNTPVHAPFSLGGTGPHDGFFNYLIGRIDYVDAFRVAHWMKFCFVITDNQGKIDICQTGNDEDTAPEILPKPK